MAANRSLLPEIGPDGLPREAPVIAYTEKVSYLPYPPALCRALGSMELCGYWSCL